MFNFLSPKNQALIAFTIFGFVYMLGQLFFIGGLYLYCGSEEAVDAVLANSKIDQQVFLFVLTINALIQLWVGFVPLLISKKWLTKVEWTSFRWKGGKATLLGLVVIVIGIPFIYYFSAKVESLLPSWMLENAMEDDSNAFYQQLEALSKGHLFAVVLSTVIIAPLTEELMFRGVIQGIAKNWTNSKHWAVWISAILFAAIHFHVAGFLPRMLLGALMGYFVLYSGSIWTAVFMHLSFNAFSLGLSMFPFAEKIFMHLVNGWFFPAVSLWLAVSAWVWGKGRFVKSQGAVNQVSSFEFKTTNEVDN
jgi:membrane protease YdiL (CAAX protease family)